MSIQTVENNSAVSLAGVTKNFGAGETQVRVLKDINLEIYYGELFLLVGPSGCGKTTLLSILAGVLDATSGFITVFDTRIDKLSQSQKTGFRRGNIGFIFQQFNLVPTLTAAENVAVPLLLAKQPYTKALRAACKQLEILGLGERRDFRPAQLSGGQQQRVAIARALVAQPRLIVCDEPTAALDGETGQHVMSLLRSIGLNRDRAVVVVTHDSRIFHYGDRIAEMNDGRILSVRVAQHRIDEFSGVEK
ncbi:MAG: ABC transporter ATP-binding protein [Acidobacteriota bacterium]